MLLPPLDDALVCDLLSTQDVLDIFRAAGVALPEGLKLPTVHRIWNNVFGLSCIIAADQYSLLRRNEWASPLQSTRDSMHALRALCIAQYGLCGPSVPRTIRWLPYHVLLPEHYSLAGLIDSLSAAIDQLDAFAEWLNGQPLKKPAHEDLFAEWIFQAIAEGWQMTFRQPMRLMKGLDPEGDTTRLALAYLQAVSTKACSDPDSLSFCDREYRDSTLEKLRQMRNWQKSTIKKRLEAARKAADLCRQPCKALGIPRHSYDRSPLRLHVNRDGAYILGTISTDELDRAAAAAPRAAHRRSLRGR